MKFLEWLLCTIQFLNPFAYFKIQKEQKRRRDESEPPLEKTWYFKVVQRPLWQVMHYWKTEYKANEVIGYYINALSVFMEKAHEFKCAEFKFVERRVRLSGATLVLDEKYAINYGKEQIYVHRKKDDPDYPWELIYRTNWLMKDYSFIEELSLVSRTSYVFQPDLFDLKIKKAVENPSTTANDTHVN